MRYFLLLVFLMPNLIHAQTKLSDLSSRELFAHTVGTCSQLLDYGNERTKLRSTLSWRMHAQDVNDMIALSKSQNWTKEDNKIAKAAGRDILAKLTSKQTEFEDADNWVRCAYLLPTLIKENYQPNFTEEKN